MTAWITQASKITTEHLNTLQLHVVAACLMTLGCVSFGLGIPTVVFGATSPKVHTPYIAGTALTCGLSAIAAGALMFVYMKKIQNDTISKRYVYANNALSHICLQSAILNISFNLWGLITCQVEPEIGRQCGGSNRSALYLLTCINTTIGLGVFCIMIAVFCFFGKTRKCHPEQKGIEYPS